MDNSPQAFPIEWSRKRPEYLREYGMTLRDYFRSDIMSGFASQMSYKDIEDIANGTKGGKFFIEAADKLADAMIAERNK